MTPEFTPSGIQVQTFDEVFSQLVAAYKGIYGSSIQVDQNDPDGQKIGIEAKLSIDLQTFALFLYSSMDPDFAMGEDLKRILKICGINPHPETQSSVILTITTDRDLILPAGFTVKDDNGQNWILPDSIFCLAGDNNITFLSQDYGDVQGPAGTIKNIDTVISGVLSAINILDAIPGQEGETDEKIRIRRNNSTENPAFSTTGSLYAKLNNLLGVTDLQVYENDTDSYDPDNPVTMLMPPHSIWIVIEGGLESDIAETTAKQKTGGTPMKGDLVTIWVETRTRPDGSTFTVDHVIRYDRPTIIQLYIRLNVHRKIPSQAIDIQLIKNKLATKNYSIGEDAQANELYCYVYQAGNNFIATSLEISIDGVTWVDDDIEAGYADELKILTSNITITEI